MFPPNERMSHVGTPTTLCSERSYCRLETRFVVRIIGHGHYTVPFGMYNLIYDSAASTLTLDGSDSAIKSLPACGLITS